VWEEERSGYCELGTGSSDCHAPQRVPICTCPLSWHFYGIRREQISLPAENGSGQLGCTGRIGLGPIQINSPAETTSSMMDIS